MAMNRGHIYLEMWYWLLDRIEDETDADKRSCMNAVQMAMVQGIDQTEGAQYEHGHRALKIAKDLKLDIIAANLDHMLHDNLYSEYQPHPVNEAEEVNFSDGFSDPELDEDFKAEQLTGYFGKVKVTTSKEWDKRHLYATREEQAGAAERRKAAGFKGE